MPKTSLAKSNPYLKDAADLKTVLLKSVATSTAIEGVHGIWAVAVKPARKKRDGASIAREREASCRSRR